MKEINNIEALFTKRLCRIVFVDDRETAVGLTAQIDRAYPQYTTTVSEQFQDYKHGLFFKKRNTTCLDQMLSNTETARQIRMLPGMAVMQDHWMPAQLVAMDIFDLRYRNPGTMSSLQKLRGSLLCDTLEGKCHFLLNDTQVDEETDSAQTRFEMKQHYLTIAKYMKRYVYFENGRRELIWITSLPIDDMLKMLGASEYRSDFYGFYTIRDGCVVSLDKVALINAYEAKNNMQLLPMFELMDLDKEDPDSVEEALRTKNLSVQEKRKAKAIREFLEKVKNACGETRLKVLTIGSGDNKHSVVAHLESGRVISGTCFRSLRTGSKYVAVIPPLDMTYTYLRNEIVRKIAGEECHYPNTEDMVKMGYDLNMLANYTEPNLGSRAIEEAALIDVSAGDSGPFTCAGIFVNQYTGSEGNAVTFTDACDIQAGDILVGINESMVTA